MTLTERLASLDLDELEAEAKEMLASGRKAHRPRAIKMLRAIQGLRRNNLTPRDLVITSVPVIPPQFRPFSTAGETFVPGDANEVYKDLLEFKRLAQEAEREFGKEGAKEAKQDLRKAVRAAYGYGDSPNPKTKSRGVKGFFQQITGTNPKTSFVQRKLLSKNQDTIGRAVIVPDANLGMNEVGLPEVMAWKQYANYIQRRLVQGGMEPGAALRHLRDKTPQARKALERELQERPVMISRAPAWHKYNTVGQYAKLVDGDAIRVNTYVTDGLNADFDGNCVIGSVIIQVRIVKETLVSIRLQNTTDGLNADLQEYLDENSVDKTGDANKVEGVMRITKNTKLIQIDESGAVFEMAIEDFPRVQQNPRIDKNGAKVYKVPGGVQVLTGAPDGKGTRWSAATELTVEEGCSLVELETSGKKTVGISDNESVAVPDGKGGFAKVTPKEALGQLAPVIKDLPTNSKGNKHDFEYGWMIGSFLSDGWVSDGYVGYTKADPKMRKRFMSSFCVAAGMAPGLVKHYTAMHVAVDNCGVGGESSKMHFRETQVNVELMRYMREKCYAKGGPEGRAALRKKMPDDISTYSREALLGVLTGLLDGDGSLSINNSRSKKQVLANYSTSSPSLRDGVQLFLRMLGIRSGCTTSKPKPGRVQKHDNYIITIAIPDLVKVAKELRPTNESAAFDLLLAAGVAKDDRDVVPVPHEFLGRIISQKPDGVSVGSLRTLKSRWRDVNYVSVARKKVLDLLAVYEGEEDDVYAATQAYAREENLMWERVTRIAAIPSETVYDIVVPETKVYAIASGLVVYDTINVSVPSLPETVQEVKDKLMPDKMLWSIKDPEKVVPGPKHEQLLGIHEGASRPSARRHIFSNEQDALDAVQRGDVSLSDEVEISGRGR